MAKLKPSNIILKGTLGNQVYTDGKYGPVVKRAVAPGTKNNGKAFKKQSNRAEYLNGLASELNEIFRNDCASFKGAGLYQEMLKRFRKEPLDNRFFLLLQLQGMDINPTIPLTGWANGRIRWIFPQAISTWAWKFFHTRGKPNSHSIVIVMS
ncbi:hypothetical protein BH11BAC4_BH11BAC4_08470 [soil metagenome]